MRFEKISFDAWKDFWNKSDAYFSDWELKEMYDNIQLPKASTPYAAGHDFYSPATVILGENSKCLLPTGVRWITEDDERNTFLAIVPRSGLGTKYGMRLTNTVGIVDADYYFASNEGHIMASISTEKELHINAGDRFMQGIVVPYLRCGEASNTTRSGGFGSTGVK